MTTAAAWEYLWEYRQGEYQKKHSALWRAMLPYLRGRVVDTSIGMGGLYEGWHGDLFASDITSTAIAICKEKLPTASLAVSDCRSTPFPDACADTVVLGDIIQHFKDFGPVLREAARLRKPDGRILVVVGANNDAQGAQHPKWSVASLERTMRDAFPNLPIETSKIARRWFFAIVG